MFPYYDATISLNYYMILTMQNKQSVFVVGEDNFNNLCQVNAKKW